MIAGMYVPLVVVLVLFAIERWVTVERPVWMARLARTRLHASRSVSLPAALALVPDAGYRDAALRERPPWAHMPELHVADLRIVPAGDGSFVVVRAGWRRQNRAVRIDATREGDRVVLRARVVPVLASSVPVLIVVFGVVVARILQGISGGGSSGVYGGLVGALGFFFMRTGAIAEKDALAAMDALEAEMIAAPSPPRSPVGERDSASTLAPQRTSKRE
jgi:hypothetical protein